MNEFAEGRRSKVLHGTCGWSDESLLRCRRFYPQNVRSVEERLIVYSTHFPCVEVDSSCYAIPSPSTTANWVKRTPPGFQFHFKVWDGAQEHYVPPHTAFGLFTSRSAPVNTLPRSVRQALNLPSNRDRVQLDEMSQDAQQLVWRHFHEALEPVYQGKRMGLVLFQFHLSYLPSAANREYILHCRKRLDQKYEMAVEFRNRSWVVGSEGEDTERWLREHGLVLVIADELLHETMQPDRAQTGLQPLQEQQAASGFQVSCVLCASEEGFALSKLESCLKNKGQTRSIMEMRLAVTASQAGCSYVRVHRRHGTHERRLSKDEIQEWAAKLHQLLPQIAGPCFFLWGTDWEDAPMSNARNLDAAVGQAFTYRWADTCKARAAAHKSNLHAFFSSASLKAAPGKSKEDEHETSAAHQRANMSSAEACTTTMSSYEQKRKASVSPPPAPTTAPSVTDTSGVEVVRGQTTLSQASGAAGSSKMLRTSASGGQKRSNMKADQKTPSIAHFFQKQP